MEVTLTLNNTDDFASRRCDQLNNNEAAIPFYGKTASLWIACALLITVWRIPQLEATESACILQPVQWDQRLAIDKTPNAIGRIEGYEIHANLYDPQKMPLVGEPFLRLTNVSTGLSCKPPQPEGMLVKVFYEKSGQYIFTETSEHAGQHVMAIQLSDCSGLWKVAYAHIRTPDRIERRPFCTGDGSEAYCFPGVFIRLQEGCKPVEDQAKGKEVTQQAFGQILEKEPTILSTDESPILKSYRKYFKTLSKSESAY